MRAYKSIEEWAKAIGSAAQTRKGRKKAIIASLRPSRGIALMGIRARTESPYLRERAVLRTDNQWFITYRTRRQRQEAFAAIHPLTLASPPPATRRGVYGQAANEVDILTLQADRVPSDFATVAGWIITVKEDGAYNNDRYSKSYHSKFGGTYEVSSRTVQIRRVTPEGTLETKDVDVSAWRGNYLLNALLTSGIVKANGGSSRAGVQLHPAFETILYRAGRAMLLYERRIGGAHYDFCAARRTVTFHAPTIAQAIAGLRRQTALARRAGRVRKAGNAVTAEFGRSLGFCREGMEQFAWDFGLDIGSSYTPKEIAAALSANPRSIDKYGDELRILAAAVGFDVPE